eukprot:6193227-Pleurochrysis_carterae.AAC.1
MLPACVHLGSSLQQLLALRWCVRAMMRDDAHVMQRTRCVLAAFGVKQATLYVRNKRRAIEVNSLMLTAKSAYALSADVLKNREV